MATSGVHLGRGDGDHPLKFRSGHQRREDVVGADRSRGLVKSPAAWRRELAQGGAQDFSQRGRGFRRGHDRWRGRRRRGRRGPGLSGDEGGDPASGGRDREGAVVGGQGEDGAVDRQGGTEFAGVGPENLDGVADAQEHMGTGNDQRTRTGDRSFPPGGLNQVPFAGPESFPVHGEDLALIDQITRCWRYREVSAWIGDDSAGPTGACRWVYGRARCDRSRGSGAGERLVVRNDRQCSGARAQLASKVSVLPGVHTRGRSPIRYDQVGTRVHQITLRRDIPQQPTPAEGAIGEVEGHQISALQGKQAGSGVDRALGHQRPGSDRMGADQASIAADPRLRGTDVHCPQLQPIGKSERANPSVVGADDDPIPGDGRCVSDGSAAEVVPADGTGPTVDAPNLVEGGAEEDGIARKDRMGSEIIGGAGNEGLIDLLPEASACLGGPGRGRGSGIDGPCCDQCVGRGPGLHEGGSTAIASGCRCACLRRYRHKQSPKSQDPSDASEDPMRWGVRGHGRILKERQLVRVLDERTARLS